MRPKTKLAAGSLLNRYRKVREFTEHFVAPLSPEDCQPQSMTEASPIKWQLGHTTWFFETFVFEQRPGFVPFDPVFKRVFNSYYNAIGDPHPRAVRGLLTRPSLQRVMQYRKAVDEAVADAFEKGMSSREEWLIELGTHHEQQHQELILTDLKHLFFQNPLMPVYRDDLALSLIRPEGFSGPAGHDVLTGDVEPAGVAEPVEPAGSAVFPRIDGEWVAFEGGQTSIGNGGRGEHEFGGIKQHTSSGSAFAFDNEGPRHRVFLEPFALFSRLVTNAEYLEFMEAGGYQRPELWLADGWDWIQRKDVQTPLYWVQREKRWHEFTLGGLRILNLQAPVVHVSFYEANAYANWKTCRLPTEVEWEYAAAALGTTRGNFAEADCLHPIPLSREVMWMGSEGGHTGASIGSAAAPSLQQMFGDVWEWTQSAYSPYPGFKSPPGAVGEYNGKFMSNQVVLRGGSCVTTQSHIRDTYRNFFHPVARWQFSGIRLAKD